MRPLPPTLLRWLATLGILTALLAAAYWLHRAQQSEADEEAGTLKPPVRATSGGLVKLSKSERDEYDWKLVQPRKRRWTPLLAVHGRVIPNPQTTLEVRAAFAGTVRALPEAGWPTLGSRVKTGALLGLLDLRVTPQELLDLQSKVAEARLKEAGAREILNIQQARVARLEAAAQTITQAELDAARVAKVEAHTQWQTAKAALAQWQNALKALEERGGAKSGVWVQPLVVPRSATVAEGEFTELPIQPGMVVEPGALIARVVDFSKALVRMDMPVLALTTGAPDKILLLPLPPQPAPVTGASKPPEDTLPGAQGRFVGLAGQHEALPQLAGCLYEVAVTNTALWRPGLFLKSYLPRPGAEPIKALSLPTSAVVYLHGRAAVYVQHPEGFKRVEVEILGREDAHWLVSAAGTLDDDDLVATQHVQVLLSEEFRGGAEDND